MSTMKIEFPVPVLALGRDDYKEECVLIFRLIKPILLFPTNI